MRILVSFEDDHRVYRDVIAAGIKILRPHTEVETAGPDTLEEATTRLEPEMVICGRPSAANSNGGPAWIEISLDPLRPSNISVDGRRWESTNPTLEELLGIIDDTPSNIRGERRGSNPRASLEPQS
jgi:hypothetical protein